MNYTAVNAKVKALRGKLLTPEDYKYFCKNPRLLPPVQNDFAKILPYLHDKNIRDFVFKNRGLNLLDKSSQESLKRVFGTKSDLQNILWLYRLKKYYKIHGDTAFAYLSPENYKITNPEMKFLAHIKDLQNFVQAVSATAHGKIFDNLSAFSRGEQVLTHAVRAQFKKEYFHENLAVVCGYLYAHRLENKNIRAISEGIKRGLMPDEIFLHLHL
ncbi:MAG: V-type ATPase subunit [Defluviitaleaceae bacterium]|nr:V-type ATPase subunit [Defluviitaleaceae bacterium]